VTIEVAAPFQHASAAAGMWLRRTPTTEVKFRGRSPPPNFSPKENHRQIEWMRNAKANAKPQAGLVRDRVTPVSQYAGALWKNIERVRALFPTSGRLAITVPRHYRDIMVAQRIISAGRAGKLNAWRFCSLTAGIREHCSPSLATYISTAQEDVLCGDHNGVAPKRQ
jgi:hypothetical protein